jgi:hypothetical protein
MRKPLVRYLVEVFVAFVVVAFVAGFGSILGFTMYATGLGILLPMFVGPTYLFFILVGSGLGYIVNRRQCSRVAPWVWILPTIWSVHFAAVDLSSGIQSMEARTKDHRFRVIGGRTSGRLFAIRHQTSSFHAAVRSELSSTLLIAYDKE